MGIRIVRGRALGAEDAQWAEPVVVVNRTLAERLWPGEDPVGKRLMPTAGPDERTVVGVAENAVYYELGEPEVMQAYVSYEQAYSPTVNFLVRTAGDGVSMIPPLQAAVAEIDPTLPFYDVATLDHLVGRWVSPRRVAAAASAISR